MSLKSGISKDIPINTSTIVLNRSLQEWFSDNKLTQWTEIGTEWEIISGQLSGSGTNISTTGLGLDNFYASDFSGSFKFRLISGTTGSGGVGIQLRLLYPNSDSVGNCLFITCRHSGSVVLNSGSYWSPDTTMASASMGIDPTGSMHTGSFDVSGSSVKVWIDDVLKITYTGSFSGISQGGYVRLISLSGSNARFGGVFVYPYDSYLYKTLTISSIAVTPSGVTGSLIATNIYMQGITPRIYKCRGDSLKLELNINSIKVDEDDIHNTKETSTNRFFNVPVSELLLDQSNAISIRNISNSPVSIGTSVIALKYQES